MYVCSADEEGCCSWMLADLLIQRRLASRVLVLADAQMDGILGSFVPYSHLPLTCAWDSLFNQGQMSC